MIRGARFLFLLAAMTAAACSGSLDSGTQFPNPMPGQMSAPPLPGASGASALKLTPAPGASQSPALQQSSATATYAIADASTGMACPSTLDGYGCRLQFNVPAPTPTPSAAPRATPSPTVSPSATPSPIPSPKAVAFEVDALPKDAPPMAHAPAKALHVTPLMMVELTPGSDYTLNGRAVARFTLPSSQIDGRGFALQVFNKTVVRSNPSYRALWSFNKSSRKENDLTFAFSSPKYTISKGTTYVVVLYGDDEPASPTPSPTATATP